MALNPLEVGSEVMRHLAQVRVRALSPVVLHGAEFPWRTYPRCEHVSFYVRVTQRVLDRQIKERTVDLAAIDVEPDQQGKGISKFILQSLGAIAKESGRVLYIENVLNTRFAAYLAREGYTKLPQIEGPSADCFIRRFDV